MTLPFTSEEFFGVFADYNQAFVGVAVALWVATLGVLLHVSRSPSRRSRTLSWFLAGLWLWNALAYHAWLFTRINPAAWLFAALFVVQALLFVRAAAGSRVEYLASIGRRRWLGVTLIAYALAYPLLSMTLGHPYPATPTFGVPCPTDILTIGAFLTARRAIPIALLVVPVGWAAIGGSAAVLLSVSTDYGLLAAGVLMVVARVRGW